MSDDGSKALSAKSRKHFFSNKPSSSSKYKLVTEKNRHSCSGSIVFCKVQTIA